MSFFKSNTTSTTTETTNTANQETGNNNGGLLKGLAIGIGTVAGIGLAAFGGTKAYKHFHVKDENRLDDVTDNETPAENAEDTTNETTLENFNEVDTEELANEEPVEAEEAKTEEVKNEAPVEAKEAKTEEVKNETRAEDEKPSASSLVDQMEKEASVFEKDMISPIEIKMAIEQMDFLMGHIAKRYITIGDNARTASAIRKMQNGVKDFWLNMAREICSQKFHPENLEDLFANDIDLIDKAYFEMKYINKSNLVLGVKDSTVEMYNRLVRLANKQKQTSNEKQVDVKSVGETQTTENCFDVFKDGHKESNKVERETKSSTKASGKKQTEAQRRVNNAHGYLDRKIETLKYFENPDVWNVPDTDLEVLPLIEDCDKYVATLQVNKASNADEYATIVRRRASLVIDAYIRNMVKRIANVPAENPEGINELVSNLRFVKKELEHMTVVKVYNKTMKRLDSTLHDAITVCETKIEEPVVDETQATTEEVPSETKIGNSEVLSDDGETVTLKASVPEDSVQNVMDVIDIVSKIPNRENPEKTDMPYYIRVIGGRISGITEPEATFLAYNDKTKSNDFIDACVSLCNMVGTGICNLADQKSNPIGSLGWINRSYDELIASGVIDNTYNPQAMRDVLTKARDEATRVLADMVKKSNETQDEANSSDETKTEETLTYTMSDKIQEAVQQSDETAATTEPESKTHVLMSPEASEMARKLQEAGELIRAKKWSDASEFYKTQLTPYLADDKLTDELREEIMSIKTMATNMLMSQKQLEAKQKAATAKASKKKSSKRRRH